MRLTSYWIRVLISSLALAAAVGTVAHFVSPQAPQLVAEDSNKGGGGG